MKSTIQSLRTTLKNTGELTLNVRVHPGAHRTAVTDMMDDGTVKIDIAAAPERGKANEALVQFLADAFGVKREKVKIVSGTTGRRKRVWILK